MTSPIEVACPFCGAPARRHCTTVRFEDHRDYGAGEVRAQPHPQRVERADAADKSMSREEVDARLEAKLRELREATRNNPAALSDLERFAVVIMDAVLAVHVDGAQRDPEFFESVAAKRLKELLMPVADSYRCAERAFIAGWQTKGVGYDPEQDFKKWWERTYGR